MGDSMDIDGGNGAANNGTANGTMEVDMGYETHPLRGDDDNAENNAQNNRREMERQRRASIKAILADESITPQERRRSIQHLMDGRRSSIGTASVASTASSAGSNSGYGGGQGGGGDDPNNPYGYGDANPYGYGDDNGPTPRQHQQSSTMYYNSDGPISFAPSEYCVPVSNENTKRAEMTRPTCEHYARNCSLVAPCCGATFGCRICHDDSPVLPPKLVVKQATRRYHRSSSMPGSFTSMEQPEDTHHTIDRFAVKEVICRVCYTKQSSQTDNCVSCGIQFGEYHCSVCNLWMSNDEKPYHCNDCGFCRVGGAENFQHCHDCGMCIDKSLYSNHNCKSGKYKSNCPVCQEYLFSSRSASHEMPCGHAIHWECFRQLAAHDSRCPVCKKTAETRERMMPTWNAMAAGVALQAVPPELARVVNITCNDCEKSDDARAWHFLGVQCRNCSSFNTVVDRIIMSGEEAHEFLETLQTRSDLTENNEDGNQRISRRRINRRRSLF